MMQNRSIKIAITGGIGSGKSTVAEILAAQGEKVFSCDKIYAGLLSENKKMTQKIISEFGEKILNGRSIDKKVLSELVFSDNTLLEKLNNITHPEILNSVNELTNKEHLCFVEVPLFFESKWEQYFNSAIVVLRDINERIAALTMRNNLKQEEAENRIKTQLNYDNCDFAEYYVIHNNGNLTDLKQKTLKILKKIKFDYL